MKSRDYILPIRTETEVTQQIQAKLLHSVEVTSTNVDGWRVEREIQIQMASSSRLK
jgi:hypothetical protein